jgi:hypothetical protein
MASAIPSLTDPEQKGDVPGHKPVETVHEGQNGSGAPAAADNELKQKPPETNSSFPSGGLSSGQPPPGEVPKNTENKAPKDQQKVEPAPAKPEGQQQQQPQMQWKKRSEKSVFSFVERPGHPVDEQLNNNRYAFVLGLQRSNNLPVTLFAARSEVRLRGEADSKFFPVLLLALFGTKKSPKHYIWTLELTPDSGVLCRQPLEDVEAFRDGKLTLNSTQRKEVDNAVQDVMNDPGAYAKAHPRKVNAKPKKEKVPKAEETSEDESSEQDEEEDDDGDYSDTDEEPPAKRQRTQERSPRPSPRTPRAKTRTLFSSRRGSGRGRKPKSKSKGKRGSNSNTPALDSGLGLLHPDATPPVRHVLSTLSANDTNARSGNASAPASQPQVRNTHHLLLMSECHFV